MHIQMVYHFMYANVRLVVGKGSKYLAYGEEKRLNYVMAPFELSGF